MIFKKPLPRKREGFFIARIFTEFHPPYLLDKIGFSV